MNDLMSALDIITLYQDEITSRPWSSDEKWQRAFQRSSLRTLLRELIHIAKHDESFSPQSMLNMLPHLNVFLRRLENSVPTKLVGYSIGYKRPRTKQIFWVDAYETTVEAAQAALRSQPDFEKLTAGLVQVGVTPILREISNEELLELEKRSFDSSKYMRQALPSPR